MTDHPASPLPERGSCTGCGACASGCPKGAIHMLPDREGFLYPTVTDACIQCGHCAHICPVRKQREPRPDPAVFAALEQVGYRGLIGYELFPKTDTQTAVRAIMAD